MFPRPVLVVPCRRHPTSQVLSYTNYSRLDIFAWSSGVLRATLTLDHHTETTGLFVPNRDNELAVHLPLPAIPQISADGTTLLFWAADNSTAGRPLFDLCSDHGVVVPGAAVLVAVDIGTTTAGGGEAKVLWTQRHDVLCNAPTVFHVSTVARRYFMVEGGALLTYDF